MPKVKKDKPRLNTYQKLGIQVPPALARKKLSQHKIKVSSAAPVAIAAYIDYLLTIGRVATLNCIQTKQGWTYVGGVALTLVLLKGITWSQTMLQKRRHLRALDDVKKM